MSVPAAVLPINEHGLRDAFQVAARDFSPPSGQIQGLERSQDRGALLWLLIFCLSGISIGMCFELLDVHAGPATGTSFFVCLIGYWAQFLVAGAYAAYSGNVRKAVWSRGMLAALLASAACDGAAQALDYVAQVEGGFMLFTIFHSSVTLFACLLAILVLKTHVSWLQWLGVLLVVLGLFVTVLPNPVAAKRSFVVGLTTSLLGSFCLAASYPLSELVFRLCPEPERIPSEEESCVMGAMLNVIAFTVWTLIYTVPRWHESIVEPILAAPQPSFAWACTAYSLYGVAVGIHSLSFWKSVHRLGTVPTAVSKGAQQAGCFVCAHLLFCHSDRHECMTWNYGHSTWSHWQKPVSFIICCFGVVVYSCGKADSGKHPQRVQQQVSFLGDESPSPASPS